MRVWLLACVSSAAVLSSAFGAEYLKLNFNPDWKFIKSDPNGAAEPNFNDREWTGVSAPHTFNDIDTFDDWSIPGHVGEMNQWSGRTWYRKSFTLPESFKGKKVFIEFEAVRQIAEVYINGRLLGVSKTGFIPFGFDLTPHLQFDGAPNVIAVMCDNRFTQETDMKKIIETELPWNSPHWHPAHGGIYRNVFLHVTDPLHICLPLYSFLETAGPYVYATEISDKTARINLEVPIQNDRKTDENVELQAEVLDHEDKVVLVMNAGGPIAAGAHAELKVSGEIDKPQLWEPDYPYLYRVVCTLSVNGQAIDTREIPLGIRTVRWDAQSGFYINGHALKLHGWGQKPTDEWPGLGAAQPDWMHFYTLSLMKEAGGNFVRWGHCAGGPASIAAADRLGLITDQPGVDGEGDAQGQAWAIRAAAFRDMIIYYRNNPSILIWEGGNQKVSREHAKELRGYVDKYDPNGGRAYAHRRADKITAEFMTVGIGTEGGREIAGLPVVEGEYDREESPRRVWDDFSPPNFGYPEAQGQAYKLTSEQYDVNQVRQYVRKLGAPEHCGGANWIFSDSTSGGRVACEVARASGEVDGVRLPKEAYYACQAMFRSDPQLHIIGHWTYPSETKKTVYVVSNAEDVELFVNNKSLGRGKVSDRYLFTFPDVAWEEGEIKAVAYSGGKPVATQIKRTAGAPVALRLTPINGPGGLHADGSDVALIDVEAVDAKGQRVPTFQDRVVFAIAGKGVWRGGYNSGKINSINHLYLDLECGVNRVAVRATRTAGNITVTARWAGRDDVKPASIKLESQPVEVANGYSAQLPILPTVALPKVRQDSPGERVAETPTVPPQKQPPPRTPKDQVGRFVKAFSYSGPTTIVHLEQNAQDKKNVYVDRDWPFAGLGAELAGADWVQAANGDSLYSAVDLMEITATPGTVVYVAHDARPPRPGWLTRQFKPTKLTLTVNGQSMTVFQRAIEKEESLTLGANTEDASVKAADMYIVFVNAAPSGLQDSQNPKP